MKLFILSILILITPLAKSANEFARVTIEKNWRICSIEPIEKLTNTILNEKRVWYSIGKMPSMVHDILHEKDVIPDLWLPGELAKNQWISQKDWLYQTEFELKNFTESTYLQFDGLDGIVDIYLNGELIGNHQNTFLSKKLDITGKAKLKNTLVLHFHTAFNMKGELPKTITSKNDKPVRRPFVYFTDYLGTNPGLAKIGIFENIYIIQPKGSELTTSWVRTKLNRNLSEGTVVFTVEGYSKSSNAKLLAKIIDAQGIIIKNVKFDLSLTNGKFRYTGNVVLEKPDLWYPRGYGGQPLYKLDLSLNVEGEKHHNILKTIAFREVIVDDRLHFSVNKKPVRILGGDWVSMQSNTMVWNQERAEKLFDLAENANFNAFRIWGIVDPPNEKFYEMADEHGFMLWQDFTLMPLENDTESIKLCLEESGIMTKRLMNHPSIFVWCGGNEDALWNHQEYNDKLEDRGEWSGIIAANAIGEQLKPLDPDRLFFPNSPYYGIDPNDPQKGNTHGYTNVWFVPGFDYINFASEDTRISCPTLPSMQKFMTENDIFPNDYVDLHIHGNIYPFPETWRKYTTAEGWKKTGPIEQFYDATDAASLAYKIGMAESQYYKETIEQQRRGRPATDPSDNRQCGGYMVWKFNDSWPQLYSAKVDYFLEPYHSYYAIKKAFQPVLVSIEKNNYLYVWIVNDSNKEIEGTLTVSAFHTGLNETRKKVSFYVKILPDESKVIARLDTAGIGTLRKEHVLFAELTDKNGTTLATSTQLLNIERNINFPDAKITMELEGNMLHITTDKYAQCINLEGNDNGDNLNWFFEDNYFNLVPGERKSVKILGKHKQGIIKAKAWYSTLETKLDYKRN